MSELPKWSQNKHEYLLHQALADLHMWAAQLPNDMLEYEGVYEALLILVDAIYTYQASASRKSTHNMHDTGQERLPF